MTIRSACPIVFCFFAFLGRGIAADYAAELKDLAQSSSPDKILNFVSSSEDAQKNNPDFYAVSANVLWQSAGAAVIDTRKDGNFALVDPQTGREAGSITFEEPAQSPLASEAVALLERGYTRFPDRLDLGLGLAHLQRELKRPKDCFQTLEKVLKHSAGRTGNLVWMNNGSLPEEAATFLPRVMQGYNAYFFNLNTPEGDALCKRLCQSVIQNFPESPLAYNMMAALLDTAGNREESLKYLELAHQKDPKDGLILLNLATAYRQMGNIPKAGAFYKKIAESEATPEIKSEAIKALETL